MATHRRRFKSRKPKTFRRKGRKTRRTRRRGGMKGAVLASLRHPAPFDGSNSAQGLTYVN